MIMKWFRHIKYVWYYPTVIGILVVVGISSTAYVYFKITGFEKQSLIKRTDSLAKALDIDEIKGLSGDEADISNPAYISFKEKLAAIKKVNPDTRFVYLTGQKDGQIYFIADSEYPETEGYSPPGQKYDEASAEFLSIFETGNPILEGPVSDRWGRWISALSPMIDPETGKVAAVVGMDIEAGSYLKTVWLYSSIPLFLTFLLLAVVSIGWVIKKEEEKMMELKSEMVSIASHEIRTPLTGISWITEGLLRKSGNMAQDQKNDIELIKSHSRNLLSTINDLLDLSAVEKIGTKKLNKQEIAMLSFLQKLAENFQLSLEEKSLNLIFDGSLSSGISVLGDEDRLKRMFNNLISNAIKYSKDGGTITVGCNIEDKKAVVWIKDQGIGIPEKDQSKIFDGFYRSENAKQAVEGGTGLGLRYVKQIAQLHGGRVWCESKENEGSTFFVEWPV